MPVKKPNVQIMECTLRDGSYAIDFQFTSADTRALVQNLEEIGFSLIEVGHGIGLGASEKKMGAAAESDENYMRATSDVIKNAEWGMFCIPGIAKIEHVDLAANYGMNFIRIGTNVNDVLDSRPFIERAKKYGMTVYANFMKSYAVKPEEFADCVKISEELGSDVAYLVDSAGGMFPEDVRQYLEATKHKSNITLGFHGHHNLGMAVANSIVAYESGVSVIDTSLQGFGRSSGNAPTELVVCALQRLGVDIRINPIDVMDVSETFIIPLIKTLGIRSIDVVCGLAQFHSSYMDTIRKYSSQYMIDPRLLIISVCEENKVDAPAELVERKAREISEKTEYKRSVALTSKFNFDRFHGSEQS